MSTRYNHGSHYENHQRAAELHDSAAHAHQSAAEAHEKQDHQTGQEHSRQALEHSQRLTKIPNRSIGKRRTRTASRSSDTLRSPNWRMQSGWVEAVRKARRMKTGSRLRISCGPVEKRSQSEIGAPVG